MEEITSIRVSREVKDILTKEAYKKNLGYTTYVRAIITAHALNTDIDKAVFYSKTKKDTRSNRIRKIIKSTSYCIKAKGIYKKYCSIYGEDKNKKESIISSINKVLRDG